MTERLVRALEAAGVPSEKAQGEGYLADPTPLDHWADEEALRIAIVADLPAIVRATAPLWPEGVKRDVHRQTMRERLNVISVSDLERLVLLTGVRAFPASLQDYDDAWDALLSLLAPASDTEGTDAKA